MSECAKAAEGGIAEPVPKPKWTDLIGIDPDYLGGKSVDEFLDEQRGES